MIKGVAGLLLFWSWLVLTWFCPVSLLVELIGLLLVYFSYQAYQIGRDW